MWLFDSREPGGTFGGSASRRVLSVLPPTDAFSGGLPVEAIAGTFEGAGETLDYRNFRPNAEFSAFLRHVIATFGPRDRELQEAALQEGEGYVYIIDLRTPEGPMGKVPPHDVVGAFEVHDGQLGVYHPNNGHVIFSACGLVQLPPSLAEVHLRELRRIKLKR